MLNARHNSVEVAAQPAEQPPPTAQTERLLRLQADLAEKGLERVATGSWALTHKS